MGQRSILVIDDQDEFCMALKETLAIAGYRAVAVANARDADKAVAQGQFDLVLTDLLMPDRDGLEVITQLRTSNPDLPVIAMSGGGRMAADDYLTLARALGAKAILEKPFTSEELLTTIAAVLAGRIC